MLYGTLNARAHIDNSVKTAYSYWMFLIVALATTHTIVVVTAPNSLRNYHILDVRTNQAAVLIIKLITIADRESLQW